MTAKTQLIQLSTAFALFLKNMKLTDNYIKQTWDSEAPEQAVKLVNILLTQKRDPLVPPMNVFTANNLQQVPVTLLLDEEEEESEDE